MTLREVLDSAADAAAEDASVPIDARIDPDGAVVWAVGSTVFATLDPSGTTASFRLDPLVAGAAARTPDVGSSFLGPEWVEFRPATLDGHAADRAAAWFAAAARRAG